MSEVVACRIRCGQILFIVICAFYISFFLNIAFYRQAYTLLNVNSLHDVAVMLSMPAVAFCVINIVLTLAAFFWLERPLIALFIVLAASAHYFIATFGIVIDRGMITNIFDTTAAESFALVTPKMIAILFISIGLPLLALCLVRYKPGSTRWQIALRRVISIAISLLVIALVALCFYKDYASLFRNNKMLIKSLSPSNSIVAINSWYVHQKMANLPLVRIGEDARLAPAVKNGARKNLTIVIVGETSRAANFSLGGYARQTNPRLAKEQVIYFPHTTSCGTATALSVPCMFSNMPRAQYDEQLASHQEGLLDVIQRAGVRVLWHENDGGCKGVCDRVPHQDITALNLPGLCINGECLDEVLFHGLEAYINTLDDNGVIVLHTIGSHGPTYSHRYPPAFRQFSPGCETNEIQNCSQQQLINTYDNTILYADFIIAKAINLLKAHDDRFTTSLVYLSDHGESLGENGLYLHGLPWSLAPDTQKQVPMLIWLSPDYQQRFGVDETCLRQQAAAQHYSQDNLFSTILGLTAVETRVYKPEDDIVRPCKR